MTCAESGCSDCNGFCDGFGDTESLWRRRRRNDGHSVAVAIFRYWWRNFVAVASDSICWRQPCVTSLQSELCFSWLSRVHSWHCEDSMSSQWLRPSLIHAMCFFCILFGDLWRVVWLWHANCDSNWIIIVEWLQWLLTRLHCLTLNLLSVRQLSWARQMKYRNMIGLHLFSRSFLMPGYT